LNCAAQVASIVLQNTLGNDERMSDMKTQIVETHKSKEDEAVGS